MKTVRQESSPQEMTTDSCATTQPLGQFSMKDLSILERSRSQRNLREGTEGERHPCQVSHLRINQDASPTTQPLNSLLLQTTRVLLPSDKLIGTVLTMALQELLTTLSRLSVRKSRKLSGLRPWFTLHARNTLQSDPTTTLSMFTM